MAQDPVMTIDLLTWVTLVEIPVLGGLFWLLQRERRMTTESQAALSGQMGELNKHLDQKIAEGDGELHRRVDKVREDVTEVRVATAERATNKDLGDLRTHIDGQFDRIVPDVRRAHGRADDNQ